MVIKNLSFIKSVPTAALGIIFFLGLATCGEGGGGRGAGGGGGPGGGACLDGDGDGYYAETGCGTAMDCNDGNDMIYPGAPERCDGIGNQCPGDPFFGTVDAACMAFVPAGCFDMGDAFNEGQSDELPVHQVCIAESFYMDVHPVTNAEYRAGVAAAGCAPPAYSSSYSRASYYGDSGYDDFPVIYVSWGQAAAFCAWAGKRPPTEAEWEYAARGGLSGHRYLGGDAIGGADANYWGSGDPWDNDTSEVEYYAPNGYGLYDMAGNVWEWVNDWYLSSYYGLGPTNDPAGPETGSSRVVRGGSWSVDPSDLRVSNRLNYDPAQIGSLLGFRCARD